MFGRRFDLFTLFGFNVRIDTSWFFLAILVTWSLASDLFPARYAGLSPATYWMMGVVGALGLFFSIVLHELSHSLMARRHGLVMSGITLFIFGGVAEMTDEPPSAKAEFSVAIAGPIASIAIAGVCFAAAHVGSKNAWPDPFVGVFKYFAMINGVLVLFNLIPAFPLDGGRVLRSILWSWKNNLTWATFVTSRIGVGFAFVLMAFGVWSAITGNVIGGIWYFLIGMFLRGAANMSYRQTVVRRSFEGETVRRFMRTDPVTVPSGISIDSLVEDYIYRYHYKMFPVMDGDRLLGCISTREIKQVPREQWARYTVGDLAIPVCAETSISPDAYAMEALAKMSQGGVSRLLVVENGGLVGVITLKDLLQFMSLKAELEKR